MGPLEQLKWGFMVSLHLYLKVENTTLNLLASALFDLISYLFYF